MFSNHDISLSVLFPFAICIIISYCYEQTKQKDFVCSASDDTTSDANLKALERFLERFPEYYGRDLFVTGESYAGKCNDLLIKLKIKER